MWLTNGGSSTMQTAANGATEFWAPLYHVSASVTTGLLAQTASQAGQVSIVFVPGSTTILGAALGIDRRDGFTSGMSVCMTSCTAARPARLRPPVRHDR